MNLVRACVAFAGVLFFIPWGMGCVYFSNKNRVVTYLGGLFASLAVFEVFAVSFHATMGSLRLMSALWTVLCGSIAAVGLWKNCRKQKMEENRCIQRWTFYTWLLFVLAVGLVVLQTLNTLLRGFYQNWDDETYCATAVISYFTDKIDRYMPQREVLREAFYNSGYNLAQWPAFSSMLAVLSGVHPAIIFHTVLPIFEIPLTYFIMYLLLDHVFSHNLQRSLQALIYCQLFVVITAEKLPVSSEWWLLLNCWTGKALAFNVVTPLIMWCVLKLEMASGEEANAYWKLLFVVCFGACLIAASLFMAVPIELAIWGIFYLFRTKRWNDFWKFALCGLPTVACALLTIIF